MSECTKEALIAALAAEYADVQARRGIWRRGICAEEEMSRAECALGAERALHKVALRLGLGWDELRERAAQVPPEAAASSAWAEEQAP